MIRKLLPPGLTAAETLVAERNRNIRRRLKSCLRKLDRIEALYDMDSVEDARARAPELVHELGELTSLFTGVPQDASSAAPAAPEAPSPSVPVGLRESFNEVTRELRTVEAAATEADQSAAMKTFLAAAFDTVRRVKAVFREKRKGEWRTPLDVYRRKLTLAVLSAIVFIAVGGSAVYAAYWYSRPRISIIEATFGQNCDGLTSAPGAVPYAVPRGNATKAAIASCGQGSSACTLPITADRFGDPAPLCGKAFQISWQCAGDSVPYAAVLAPEATGKRVTLACSKSPRLQILEATYGANCAGKPSPNGGTYSVARGNMTAWMTSRCDAGAASCSTTVQLPTTGDPALLCAKDFEVSWSCSNDGKPRQLRIEAEALDKSVELACR